MSRKVKVLVSSLCGLLLVISVITIFLKPISGANKDEQINLILEANQNQVSLGEELIITCYMKNISKQQFAFSSLQFNSFIVLNSFYDEEGNQLPKQFSVLYDFKYLPDRDDFFTLNPNEVKEIETRFVVKWETLNYRNKEYYGYILDSENLYARILLGKNNIINLHVEYAIPDFELNRGREIFNIDNLYLEPTKSNQVQLQIH